MGGKCGAIGQSGAHLLRWYLHAAQACGAEELLLPGLITLVVLVLVLGMVGFVFMGVLVVFVLLIFRDFGSERESSPFKCRLIFLCFRSLNRELCIYIEETQNELQYLVCGERNVGRGFAIGDSK